MTSKFPFLPNLGALLHHGTLAQIKGLGLFEVMIIAADHSLTRETYLMLMCLITVSLKICQELFLENLPCVALDRVHYGGKKMYIAWGEFMVFLRKDTFVFPRLYKCCSFCPSLPSCPPGRGLLILLG